MAMNDLLGSIGLGGGTGEGMMGLVWLMLIVIGTFIVLGGIVYFFYNMRRWNIKKVYFRIPRDVKYAYEGKELDLANLKCSVKKETGKGIYDAKKGVVFVKRKGKKKVEMKPFNLSQYLDADGNLEVIQTGADNFIPVMPKSYVVYEDDKTGERVALIDLTVDRSESKAWKTSFERNAKQAFSIVNLLQQYQVPIMIGLVIMLWGIQLFILYNKIK